MRYREAKALHNEDQVKRKSDGAFLIVKNIEVYGQLKIVRINCVDEANSYVSLYNDEIE